MAFIPPTQERYNPALDLKESGEFWCRCIGVRQGLPHPEFEGKTNVAIEFEVTDERYPKLLGKRVAIVAQETLYESRDKQTVSHLLTHCRNMRATFESGGCDPEQFVGKDYYCRCELYKGRAFVRMALPANTIAGRPTPTMIQNPKAEPPPIDGEEATYP